MDLLWPGFLFLLIFIPILIVAYIWILRRRKRSAVRYSSLALVRDAMPKTSQVRRHLPFALLISGLSSLVIAMGRPVGVVTVPTGQTTIILAIDVSRSMCSTDIEPNRLVAAEQAALSFVQNQPPNTQIGIVAFAGFAELVQPPTNDVELLEDVILSLQTGRRTAIGASVLKSLDAISEVDPSVAPSTSPSQPIEPTPVPEGAYAPDIIVVLTDGVSNAGPEPLYAAEQAADRGVRVYTIGFGTERGSESPMICNDMYFGGGTGGSQQFGGGGGGFRRGIDEVTLMRMAEMTDGEYYAASSASELNEVLRNLPTNIIARHETIEVSVIFTAIGALLAALAMGLALKWNPLL
jgi:Ca-activated chloride channel homolog